MSIYLSIKSIHLLSVSLFIKSISICPSNHLFTSQSINQFGPLNICKSSNNFNEMGVVYTLILLQLVQGLIFCFMKDSGILKMGSNTFKRSFVTTLSSSFPVSTNLIGCLQASHTPCRLTTLFDEGGWVVVGDWEVPERTDGATDNGYLLNTDMDAVTWLSYDSLIINS